ncbi:hypothetical protein EHS39_26120 [Ensifer sp. MPMI2T]|nr:hypothetical protein EHS39_26120 [Ensifer sp. MPMI2T]
MRVYAYRVQQRGPRALEEVLRRINDLPLADRHFLGARSMRLEIAREQNGLWFADFAAPRNGHGPGTMAVNQPMSEIALAAGALFGEDTGFVYDPHSRYLVLQYNHTGPRDSGISKYLAAADLTFGGLGPALAGVPDINRCGFSIGAVLKPDAYARLRQWGIYKSVEMEISVPGALNADLAAGRSLGSVLAAPLPDGVETITIGFTARPGNEGRLGGRGVEGVLNDLQQLGMAVKSAVVKGKPSEEDRMDSVNLVSDRVSGDANVTLGHGLRFVREDRWAALAEKLQRWADDRVLP